MILLRPEQIRLWDSYTIKHEPISELELMERAAGKAAAWLISRYSKLTPVTVFCGKGNNGGDGLVIARLLLQRGFRVQTCIIEYSESSSFCFQENLEKLAAEPAAVIVHINNAATLALQPGSLLIDAIFGTAMRLPVPLLVAEIINRINALSSMELKSGERAELVSIDIPSGLSAEFCAPPDQTPVHAAHTLSFQVLKPSFLLPDTGVFCGNLILLDIGLPDSFLASQTSSFHIIDSFLVKSLFKQRLTFSHKGIYGHSLIIAGSRGKMGAAVLAARGCLHSGVGLLTVLVPSAGTDVLQQAVPEAMVMVGENSGHISSVTVDFTSFSSIVIGPGIGTHPQTREVLLHLLRGCPKPIVIDADALNILSSFNSWTELIPEGSILTPHVGEFDRLAGRSITSFERLQKQQQLSVKTRSVIILKGAYTSVCLPCGETWFNTTGNPGMATGGSGDTLTGILGALLSQGYTAADAARIGVFIHGRAGDLAAIDISQTALSAGLLITYLGKSFCELEG